jgi:hypothetical protein
MSQDHNHLNGVQVLCQFTPKCRKKALLGQNRRHLDLNSRSLPAQESRIEKDT